LTSRSLAEAARAGGVTSARVLSAVAEVPREAFVPPESAADAYIDAPIRIPHGQVTTQPSLVARMVEALDLEGRERVLEVGTGYGWQTALLARLADFVWSVERYDDLAERSRANLTAQQVGNVEVVTGDGSRGLLQHAPFDAIIVSAAFPDVPGPLAQQLAAGGRLVQPIGRGGNEQVVLFEKGVEGLERRETVILAHFVRLYGAHGYRDER
jgi:protein-L-isoaspartate(D-aspartate) O-methyltransferase